MNLTRPVLQNNIKPFDAANQFDFIFSVVGGSQVFGNNLVIENIENGTEVYNQTIASFQFKHTLPSNSLTNGVQYRAKVRTYDINNNFSQFSDWAVFWAFSSPTVTIPTLDSGTVNNHTVLLEGSYVQNEGELLQSYRYLLYDQNERLLAASVEKFDGLLTHQFAGLMNDTNYKAELRIITANRMESSSGLIPFHTDYIQPQLTSVLTLRNIEENANIKISANIIQIIGEIGEGTIDYIDGDWIDLRNGMIYFQDGFSVDKDFSVKIWLKNIRDTDIFLKLIGEQGYIELRYYNNRIHAFKRLYQGGVVPHFASSEFIAGENDTIFICLKHIEDLIGIFAEVL